jgi:predicted GIY-YIG superfamily endonuclease
MGMAPFEGLGLCYLPERSARSKRALVSTTMKPFYLYILRCRDSSYYVGHTDDLEKRVAEHQAGTYQGYTSARRPIALVYAAEFPTRQEALEREQQLKGWSRAKKEALISGNWEPLPTLARGRNQGPSTGSGQTGEMEPPNQTTT